MSDAITLKKSAGGVLLKNADGVLIKECGGCRICPGGPQNTLEIVLSDITECPCGSDGGSYLGSARSWKFATPPSVGPNGTFTLTNYLASTGACRWQWDQVCTGEISLYGTVDCTGDVLFTYTVVGFRVDFWLDTYKTLRVSYTTKEGENDATPVGAFVESAVFTIPNDCTGPYTFATNEIVCDDIWPTQNWLGLFSGGAGSVDVP